MTAALLLTAIASGRPGPPWISPSARKRRWARLTPVRRWRGRERLGHRGRGPHDPGSASTVHLGSTLGVGETTLRLEPLAGPVSHPRGRPRRRRLGLPGQLGDTRGTYPGHGTGAGYLLLLGAVVVILVAADAFTFLFAWEALTVSFYMLVGIHRRDAAEARASWVTLGVGKLSGAALLFGFLLLAGRAHSYAFSAWGLVPGGALRDTAFALVVVGFGAKAGLVPLQVWLPIGYPAAPGPIRAAMAGLAVNVGFYGLWRFLGILGHPPIWLAAAVLIVGGVTALLGIVFAAVQSGLNRVIAYSSVENAGVIVVGYGVGLAGAATHNTGVMAIGLVAASLQVLAHAVAKSSLFASSAFFESDFGSDDLEMLRGVGRTRPMERHRLRARIDHLGGTPAHHRLRLGMVHPRSVAPGVSDPRPRPPPRHGPGWCPGGPDGGRGPALLHPSRRLRGARPARSRRRWPERRSTVARSGRVGLAILGLSCLVLAAAAPWVIRFIADGLAPVVPHATTIGALKEPWVLQPVFADFSILSPSWLFVVLPIGLATVALATLVFSRGSLLRVRRVPAWRSATPGVAGPDSYSPFGYANVLRHVLSNVLGSQRSSTAADPATDAGVAAATPNTPTSRCAQT